VWKGGYESGVAKQKRPMVCFRAGIVGLTTTVNYSVFVFAEPEFIWCLHNAVVKKK